MHSVERVLEELDADYTRFTKGTGLTWAVTGVTERELDEAGLVYQARSSDVYTVYGQRFP